MIISKNSKKKKEKEKGKPGNTHWSNSKQMGP